MYRHHSWHSALLDCPVSRMIYVGSNYANHVKEMSGSTPEEPVLFIKPETALYDLRQPLVIPSDMGSIYHGVELVVLIDATLRQATEERVHKAIAGYDVALDLTLRDIQDKMRKTRQPQEKTKGLDNSCPLSGFTPVAELNGDPRDTVFGLTVNGELRRHDTTADMIHHIVPLIAYISRFFILEAGNVVLTGTPTGVEPLNSGDGLAINFRGQTLATRVL